MNRVLSLMALIAATAFLAVPVMAQPGGGLESTHPDVMHPMEGTMIAELAPVNGAPADATGQATFNYNRGRDQVIVRVTVEGLEPNTAYQLHVASHKVAPVDDLAVFMTDENGDGEARARVDCLPAFNLVNIREPNKSGSRRLTSWADDGGTLEQTPDRRRNNAGSPPESCPAS